MQTLRRCLYVTQLPGSVKNLISQSVSKLCTRSTVILKHQTEFLQFWLSHKHHLYKLLFAKFDLVDAISSHVYYFLPSLPLDIRKTLESDSQKTEDRSLPILDGVKRTVSRLSPSSF